jgi:hypothetical protein
MNWPLAILAIILGVLSLANLQHVDTSAEALHVMGKLREALKRCEATKPHTGLDAPASTAALTPMPAVDDTRRSNDLDALTPAPAPTSALDDAKGSNGLDASAPTPERTLPFDDARRRTIAIDTRPHQVAFAPTEARGREAGRRECGLEAQRLGRTAALWCAGL